MSTGVLDVAKKQAKPEAKAASPTEEWSSKKLIFQMRGSEAFKAWLQRLAEFDATDATEVVERSLAAYARQIGFADPRPKR